MWVLQSGVGPSPGGWNRPSGIQLVNNLAQDQIAAFFSLHCSTVLNKLLAQNKFLKKRQ